jgi:Ca2+/H+ antiporter
MSYLRNNFEGLLREIKEGLMIIPVGIFCFLTLFYLVYIGNSMLSGRNDIVGDILGLVLYILLVYPLLSLVYGGKNKKEHLKIIRGSLNSITAIFYLILLAIKHTQVLKLIGLSPVFLGESDDWLLFAIVGMCLAIFIYLVGRLFQLGRDVDLT